MRSSVKPSHANDEDDLVGRTRKVWQPRLGRELSHDDARQIAANMTGFFSVLAGWSTSADPIAASVPDRTEAQHER